MGNTLEYLQPDFYHFNEDSIILKNIVTDYHSTISSLLDVGSGCGVMGIEIARKSHVSQLTLLEKQVEFLPYIQENLKLFNTQNYKVINEDILTFEPNSKFDVIISNPPYFREEASRKSSNEKKNICRILKGMTHQQWFEKTLELCKREGYIYWISEVDDREVFHNSTIERLHVDSRRFFFRLQRK
jgi:tRNA1Val (adenine37-N6)-methyltransferase